MCLVVNAQIQVHILETTLVQELHLKLHTEKT